MEPSKQESKNECLTNKQIIENAGWIEYYGSWIKQEWIDNRQPYDRMAMSTEHVLKLIERAKDKKENDPRTHPRPNQINVAQMNLEMLNRGDLVIYIDEKRLIGPKEEMIKDENLGIVSSKNDTYVFVKFETSIQACRPQDLYTLRNRPDLIEKITWKLE